MNNTYRHRVWQALVVAGVLATAGLLVVTPGLAKTEADSEAQADEPAVYGWVEKTTLEPWGVELKAKLDSGALTSSLHAENIEEFEQEGEAWVRFDVNVVDLASGEPVSRRFEKPIHRRIKVTGAGGSDRRKVVLMTLCLGDTRYEEQVSLENREKLHYPVLLGRRTIKSLGLLDTTETFLHAPRCDENSPLHEYAEETR